MRKFGILATTIFISTILAGLYGIIHDNITYSISTEYFTKFKFIQFGIGQAVPYRLGVSLVGFFATWWTGIFIGIVLGLTGLIFKDHKSMFKAIVRAIGATLIVAILTGFVGFLYGKFHLIKTGVDWWLPNNLIDKNDYIIVGSIHNFSYLGGLLGLIVGVIYLVRQNKIQRVKQIRTAII